MDRLASPSLHVHLNLIQTFHTENFWPVLHRSFILPLIMNVNRSHFMDSDCPFYFINPVSFFVFLGFFVFLVFFGFSLKTTLMDSLTATWDLGVEFNANDITHFLSNKEK